MVRIPERTSILLSRGPVRVFQTYAAACGNRTFTYYGLNRPKERAPPRHFRINVLIDECNVLCGSDIPIGDLV